MKSKYERLRDAASKHHSAGFRHLLSALHYFRTPRPHLCEIQTKEAQLNVTLIQVLLDQMYPRELWERVLDEMTQMESTGDKKHPLRAKFIG